MYAFLVLTDFSPPAASAARLAIVLAARWPARLVFGHVMRLPVDWESLPDSRRREMDDLEREIAEARSRLEGWVAKAREAKVEASFELRVNDALSDLYEEADQPFDLLIMGTEGKRRFGQLLSGSTAQRLMRLAPPPVLIVKEGEEPVRPDRILFATELDEGDSSAALQQVMRFKDRVGATQLGVTRINTPYNFRSSIEQNEAFRRFVDGEDTAGVQWLPFSAYQVDEGIVELASSWGADLVAISTHAQSDLASLFLDSIPIHLAHSLPVPLLSYRIG